MSMRNWIVFKLGLKDLGGLQDVSREKLGIEEKYRVRS
jgi:hypothetical protein